MPSLEDDLVVIIRKYAPAATRIIDGLIEFTLVCLSFSLSNLFLSNNNFFTDYYIIMQMQILTNSQC